MRQKINPGGVLVVTIELDFINFSDSCDVQWEGEAFVDDGSVFVVVENGECVTADCGPCIYDWSFQVMNVPSDQDIPIMLSAYGYPRKGCSYTYAGRYYNYTIPKDALPKGVVCRPAVFDTLESMNLTGGWNLPCDSPDMGKVDCDQRLDCVPSPEDESDNRKLCMYPCSDDGDCDLPDLMSCTDGYCQLTETW